MATPEKSDSTSAPQPQVSNTELVKALAEALHAPRPGERVVVPYGMQQIRSSFNPTGKRKRVLKRVMYQNHNRLHTRVLADDEIALLDQIKQGTYMDGLVTVIEQKVGLETQVFITYKNKTPDQRQELDAIAPRFIDKLRRIVEEMGVKTSATA